MSRLTRMAPGLIGLALAVPTAARAELPPSCRALAQPWNAPSRAARADEPPAPDPNEIHHPASIDPSSLETMRESHGRIPPPPGVTLGTCAACQRAEAPGYASTGGSSPGYASVGGPGSLGEPVPIGVVQAGYRPMAAMGAPTPGGFPGPVAGGAGGMVQPSPLPFAGPLPQPNHRRPHFLAHLLDLPSAGRRAERQFQEARSAHAAMSYGPNNQAPIELPSSMVYGGR